jgi:hypothetical protein
MRLPRVRFTVRRLMIAVAVVAVLIGAGISVRRSIFLSREAAACSGFESFWRDQGHYSRKAAEDYSRIAKMSTDSNFASELRGLARDSAEQAEHDVERADYFGRLKAKYEAAVRRPWLSVEPDPPNPGL